MASALDNQPARRTVPPAYGSRPRARDQRGRRNTIAAVLFLTPSMIGFTLFVILPALGAFALSFFEWDLFGTPRWAGLANFSRLFQDPQMWTSLRITVEFVVLGVIPTIVIGFVLAVLINNRMRGIGAVRILYFAPMVASSAVAAVLWAYMYDPHAGIANRVLGWVGLGGTAWLSSTTWALPALTLMMIWLGLPLVMILYLAGLQRIPADIYAAAALDGAGWWRRLWSITWPNVRATTILVATLQVINFVSNSLEVSLMMTDGGPLGHTQTLALYAYKTAFGETDMGYASALSLFQLALIALIVGLFKLFTRLRRSA
ncbi:carbohydrate ABC transporter permease [Actinomadura opuntiae]|uniref:carbohydrate ABC transporter permease n=1 Tax=Actinomadura sp. OS1-43 TaxID=604315 RepID=UPI00255AF8F2|nr:sugar ABC transporter permease [Actinomadura sp. OS1-43]MDL4821831.1 sugar ABC transporter permease [Actinomadura sp. OS1-43]